MKASQILIPVFLLMFSVDSFAQQPAAIDSSMKVKTPKTAHTHKAAHATTVDRGLKKYGDVAFADPGHHKYPINTDNQIRSAWRSIHVKNHASKYSPEELAAIHNRIQAAAERHGIHFKSKD